MANGTIWKTTEDLIQRNSMQLTDVEDRLQSLERKMASRAKKLDDGFAKVRELLNALIEEQKGNKVTSKSDSVLHKTAHDDENGGTEEAEIKTDNTIESLGDFSAETDEEDLVTSESINSSDLVQELYKNQVEGCETIQDSDDVEIIEEKMNVREVNSGIEVQGEIETAQLVADFENHNWLKETSPKVDLMGWVNIALNLFDKMPNKDFDKKNSHNLGLKEAADNHRRGDGLGIIFGKLSTSKDSVGAILVFDPGGRDLNFVAIVHLEDKVAVGRGY